MSNEEKAMKLLGALVSGIEWWASQEDGIPEELCADYVEARGLLNWEYFTEAQRTAFSVYTEQCRIKYALIAALEERVESSCPQSIYESGWKMGVKCHACGIEVEHYGVKMANGLWDHSSQIEKPHSKTCGWNTAKAALALAKGDTE